MSEDNIQALLREGIAEARLGHKEAAREMLRQVVAAEPNNEKAWLWLASVEPTEHERRGALKRVLVLNPNNEQAQRALEKMGPEVFEGESPNEIIPGVSRRTFQIAVGGGVAVILLILIAFIVVTISNNNRRAQEESRATAAVLNLTRAAEELAAQQAGATLTAAAMITPTLPPTRTPIPTWTPTDAPVSASGLPTPLPTPQELTGRLSGWSGRDLQSVDYLSVGTYDLTTGLFAPIGSDLGRDVRFDPTGQRVVYTRYDQITFDTILQAVNTNNSGAEALGARWNNTGVFSPQMPDLSPDGSRLVFVGTDPETQLQQIFMVNMNATDPSTAMVKLTSDSANYSYPALSPDGSQIVAARTTVSGSSLGPDLVIISIENQIVTPLTTDVTSFEETMPRWSPDGSQIVYAAAPANDPGNYDIVTRASAGFGLPAVVVRSDGSDLFPVYSPDGRYLAFASDRSGQWDIYIHDFGAQATFQLTNTQEEDYPGDWS